MRDFVFEYYGIIKSLHVIFVISWMAGLLYLPRLFVYHTTVSKDSDTYKIFSVMEFRLIRYIMTPSMLISYISGSLLLYTQDFAMIWLHVKLAAILLMMVAHGFMIRYYKMFKENRNQKTTRFFRVFNEIPTILMIIIVIMVIKRPF